MSAREGLSARDLRRATLTATKICRHLVGYATAAVALRLCADERGTRPLFDGRPPRIENRGWLSVGSGFRVRGAVARTSISVSDDGVLTIGSDVFVNQGCRIHAERSVTIGDRVDIGDDVRISDTNFHATRPGSPTRTAPVVIESDVWIASGATILPGVTVGRGAVIGTGAVVVDDVAPGAIVAGPRAVEIGRFAVPEGFNRRSQPGYLP
nr:acyltransferase [Microbacterium radiodurans]